MPAITVISPAATEIPTHDIEPFGGLAAGARALQDAGLQERLAASGITIDRIIEPQMPNDRIPQNRIDALGVCNSVIAAAVQDAIASSSMPVPAGGTCRHLPGMVAGLQQALPPGTRLGLLWLDAHGDFNTPHTTLNGRLVGCQLLLRHGYVIVSGAKEPA